MDKKSSQKNNHYDLTWDCFRSTSIMGHQMAPQPHRYVDRKWQLEGKFPARNKKSL